MNLQRAEHCKRRELDFHPVCPDWDLANNVPAYSTQCKTINVSQTFLIRNVPLPQQCSKPKMNSMSCHSDDHVRKCWDREAETANVPGSQIHGAGLAHSHHFMLFLNIQATEHLKKLALKMIIGIGSWIRSYVSVFLIHINSFTQPRIRKDAMRFKLLTTLCEWQASRENYVQL